MTPDEAAGELLRLAGARFGDLEPAEENLLRAAARGEPANADPEARAWDDAANTPGAPGFDVRARRVRAALIRWLCVDPEASRGAAPRGLQLFAAVIVGGLDLSFAAIPWPVGLFRCLFKETPHLLHASVPAFHLRGSHCPGLTADGLRVQVDVFLDDGFQSKGQVRLVGADIGGSLGCGGGHFRNPGKEALSCDSIKVGRSVFLHQTFHAKGEVRLLGAEIGGDLDCAGGHFRNPGNDALSCDRIKVGGSVFLREQPAAEEQPAKQFRAEGKVRLLGAAIGGDLDCGGGHFCNLGNDALSCDGMKVGGSTFLRQGFTVEGKAGLTGTQIGARFVLRRAQISEISLAGASADVLDDEIAAWPAAGNIDLDGFTYRHLAKPEAAARLEWLRLQLPPDAEAGSLRLQPYRQLAKVLKDQGLDSEARAILIGMEDDRLAYGDLRDDSRRWQWFLGKSIAYGYRPFLVLRLLRAFWLAGLVIFGIGYAAGGVVPAHRFEAAHFVRHGEAPGYYPDFNLPAYAADSLLPIISLDQRDNWIPASPDARLPGCTIAPCPRTPSGLRWFGLWVLWYFRWADTAAGWLLVTLFLGALGGLVRRE